jgi:hypothetical protein
MNGMPARCPGRAAKSAADGRRGESSMKEASIVLNVDDKDIPLNPFVRKIMTNTIEGMVRSLDNVAKNPREIRVTITKEVKG